MSINSRVGKINIEDRNQKNERIANFNYYNITLLKSTTDQYRLFQNRRP
jgi:hypothetical protein